MALRHFWRRALGLSETSGRRSSSSAPHHFPADSGRYAAELVASLHQPEEYWAAAAEKIVWSRRWERVLENPGSPFAKWFPGGELSLCYNAVDRHVDEGHGEQTALIWDSAITGRWVYGGSLTVRRSYK